MRVRPLNGAEVEDKKCTEIVHVLDENVSANFRSLRNVLPILYLGDCLSRLFLENERSLH